MTTLKMMRPFFSLFNKNAFLLFLLSLGGMGVSNAATHYVKSGSTGNGTSWATAFGNPADALAIAVSGDEIWVAEGTYLPTMDEFYIPSPFPQRLTFNIPAGVSLFGGFPAIGNPVWTDRDFLTFKTTLSGDHLGNDIGKLRYNHPTIKDNSRNLILMLDVGTATELDGFFITGGAANRNASNINIPNGNPSYNGGAIFMSGASSPLIKDCIFTWNMAYHMGGCIYVYPGYDPVAGYQTAIPTVINCVFEENRTYFGGTAIALDASPASTANCKITNCEFIANRGGKGPGILGNARKQGVIEVAVDRCTFDGNYGSKGGCFYYDARDAIVNTTVSNSLFINNSSKKDGAIQYSKSRKTNVHRHYFVNNTIANNTSLSGEAMIKNKTEASPVAGVQLLSLYNNIFAQNSVAGGTQYWTMTNTGTHTDADYNSLDTTNCPANTNCLGNNIYGANPQFVSATDFNLQSTSPLVEAGEQSLLPSILNLDLAGNTRVVGSNVDIGCYENPTPPVPCPPILYVNASATGNNTGTSWNDAYTELYTALDFARNNTACVNQIWVAEGTYYATNSTASGSNGIHLQLVNDLEILGGFPNTGNPTYADQDWMLHPTILDGDFQQDGNFSNNTFSFFKSNGPLNSGTLTRGFYMTNFRGYAIELGLVGGPSSAEFLNMDISNCWGGISYTVSNTVELLFENIRIHNNSTNNGVNIMSTSGTDNTLFENCVWENNNTGCINISSGGAGSMTPMFLNCEFSNNTAFGSAVLTHLGGSTISSPKLVNCKIYNNSGSEGTVVVNNSTGGAAEPELINCTLYGNSASNVGGCFYQGPTDLGPCRIYVKNSIVWNSSAGFLGSIAFLDDIFGCPNPNEIWFQDCMVEASSSFDMFAFDIPGNLTGFPCAFVFGLNTTWLNVPPSFVSVTPGSENLRLQLGTNGIDVGSGTHVPANVFTELAGNPRIVGGVVDKGCYENFAGMMKAAPESTTLVTNTIKSWKCFPNPSSGIVNLKGSISDQSQLIVQVYDISGRMLLEQNSNAAAIEGGIQIDISGFSAGTYLLTIAGKEFKEYERLIVK